MSSPVPPPPDRPVRGGARASNQTPGVLPRVLAGRYRLDSVIGKGSMGTVWAATDQVLHRQVAIKEIDFPPGTPAAERAQLEARTLREARAIAALSNPYVITLFDILTLDHGPVIVMELLRARSLAEILRHIGRLPDGQAATIGVAVASGLIAAHAAGITHRDVKPGNVLICDDGRIKLTDFGIARSSADQTMTATGLLLGSPAYIAPEVANGVPVGPISDAWSLGGLLFATVEGRPPFDQGTAIATLTSVVKDPVPPHPHSGRLGAVVSGLLVKTPALRMRIDRALTIMRTVADDPSGMNLAAISRIPRNQDTAPGPPTIRGGTGTNSTPARSTNSRPDSTGTGPSQRSTSPPLRPTTQPSPPAGPGPAARPQRPAQHQSTQHQPAQHQSAQPGWSTPTSSPTARPEPERPRLTSSRSADPRPAPSRPSPAASAESAARDSRQIPLADLHQALPPPPWAPEEAAALPPLPLEQTTSKPETGADSGHSRRFRILAAALAAILAAVLGFLGVRIVADLAGQSAARGDSAVRAVLPPSSDGHNANAPAAHRMLTAATAPSSSTAATFS